MTDRKLSPPPGPSPESIDSDPARAAADSRIVLEGLAADLGVLLKGRREMPMDHFGFALQLWCAAAVRHMCCAGVPPKRISRMFSDLRDLVGALAGAHVEIKTLLQDFERFEAEDPAAAEAFVKRFAQVGQFIVAERLATHPAPGKTQ
jgi:hypothetical protein